jgi:hypothetical protein
MSLIMTTYPFDSDDIYFLLGLISLVYSTMNICFLLVIHPDFRLIQAHLALYLATPSLTPRLDSLTTIFTIDIY